MNIDMTLDVMAHSLVYWGPGRREARADGKGGRIFSMTSSGSTRVFATYGAVRPRKRRWNRTPGSWRSSSRRAKSP